MGSIGSPNGDQVDLAEYLFRRLYQLGVRSVQGVPGDYNLVSLDYIKPAGLYLAGNANELNAGYAADGYARVKGISALVTLFGVGELSALNAIGGAFAEKAPVVHIIGTPPTHAQNLGLNLHHSFGDGDFKRFVRVYRESTCAQANLVDPGTAPAEIYEVLRQCLKLSRPAKVSLLGLKGKLGPFDPGMDFRIMHGVIVDILKPDELIRATGYPTYVTPFGKGAMNWVNSCDLVIRFGPLDIDTNTYGFTTLTDRKVIIDIHRYSISIGRGLRQDLNTKDLLRTLLPCSIHPLFTPSSPLQAPIQSAPIDQATFWTRMSKFLRPSDIILTETGTSSSGGQDLILPPQATMINSALWLSIGYTLGATVGVALAQKDLALQNNQPTGRTNLFDGDGSFQMTTRSISVIFGNRLNVIFLINNNGYTIERHIHAVELPGRTRFFGAPTDDPSYPVLAYRATNWGELLLMDTVQVKAGKGFSLVEVVMGQDDAPASLERLVRMAAERNEGLIK
ncbi:thiamine diphosphate-binding protein [Aspergillus cavernicola]|uniref:Pyruvate decarboxylase n=1 Tax=Aspergillus cavernicola TaxID=176166 RepID=A0ABR4II10_9EURO